MKVIRSQVAIDWSADHSQGVVMHKLERAVETRYIRFVIEEADEGREEYIGLQVGPRQNTETCSLYIAVACMTCQSE